MSKLLMTRRYVDVTLFITNHLETYKSIRVEVKNRIICRAQNSRRVESQPFTPKQTHSQRLCWSHGLKLQPMVVRGSDFSSRGGSNLDRAFEEKEADLRFQGVLLSLPHCICLYLTSCTDSRMDDRWIHIRVPAFKLFLLSGMFPGPI